MGLTRKNFEIIDNNKIVTNDKLVFYISQYRKGAFYTKWDEILSIAKDKPDKFIGVTVKYNIQEIKFLVRASSLYFVGFYVVKGATKVGYAVGKDDDVAYQKGGNGYDLEFNQGQISKYFQISYDKYNKLYKEVNAEKPNLNEKNMDDVWNYFFDGNMDEDVRIAFRFMETLISEAARMETSRNIFECLYGQNKNYSLKKLENHQPTMGNWMDICEILGNDDGSKHKYECISMIWMNELLKNEKFWNKLGNGDGTKLKNIGLKLPPNFPENKK